MYQDAWGISHSNDPKQLFFGCFLKSENCRLKLQISPYFSSHNYTEKHISRQLSPQFFPEIEIEPQESAGYLNAVVAANSVTRS
jgi:hypothetical protein